MALIQWRRFNFFDKDVVKEPGTNAPFDKLKDIQVTCTASGRGQLVLGDNEGNILLLDRDLHVTGFKAYEYKVTHMQQLRQNSVLVTVGEDEPGCNPQLKVWNLDKLDKFDVPTCTRFSKAATANQNPSPVTCVAAHENLNLVALGFEDGSVVLHRGDITRNSPGKQRVIHEGPRPITGLAWRLLSRNTVLFVATEFSVMSVTLANKDRDTKMMLDQHGCEERCCVMSDAANDSQFVIGRNDAVYFYQTEERGPCLAFEGPKVSLHWFRGCLITVAKEARSLAQPAGSTGPRMNIVNVYDIQNKLIAYSVPIPNVVDVLLEWGSLYVLSSDGRLYQLREKDTQSKLDILFRKNMYQLAIALAKSQQYDDDGLVDIFRQYGDHLYSKGDYDGAIQQYLKTIGKLEASYVIRKFLDPQRVHNLTVYLQELHTRQLASEEHTTLLLSCYTKLHDTQKLNQFINSRGEEVNFEVDTAIRVCRSAGFYAEAVSLAQSHGRHSAYLRLQLEDLGDCPVALAYIAGLPFPEAEQSMRQYGKMLLAADPAETTRLLKLLCTDYKPKDAPLVDASVLEGAGPTLRRANAEDFIHVFVDNSSQLRDFLEYIVKVQPSAPPVVYNTVLELYLQDLAHEKEDIAARCDKQKKTLELLQNPECQYDMDHALVLCQMTGFKAGILYLYEKAHLYHQILKYHMDHQEHVHVIDTCKKFGSQDSSLWLQALSYFADKHGDCKPQVTEVLQQIDRQNLVPPLLVIQTLAHSPHASLGVVKDYLARRLEAEQRETEEDEKVIQQLKAHTDKMRAQIDDLQSSAQVFQVSKCGICSHPLELPSLHFLCGHSFHQHCFESYCERESECVACAAEHQKLREMLQAQAAHAQAPDIFHSQLDLASDGFSVVAEFFARGLFNKLEIVDDGPAQSQLRVSDNPFE